MHPGGKPEAGETAAQTAARELAEEVGIVLAAGRAGRCWASGSRTPPTRPRRRSRPRSSRPRGSGSARPSAEIAEIRWLDLAAELPDDLAPLLTDHVLPALSRAVRLGPAARPANRLVARERPLPPRRWPRRTGSGTAPRSGRSAASSSRVRAALHDPPVLDHQDLVGGADRRQPVGDHDRGAALQRLAQRLLHGGLGGGVQVRRWPRRGSPPAAGRAAAGRWSAAAARRRRAGSRARPPRCPGRRAATATRSSSRARRSASHSCSSVASGRARSRLARMRLVEQVPVLGDHAEGVRAASRTSGRARPTPAEPRRAPGVDVVQARQQLRDRRLARARGADQRDHLARLDPEGDAVQHLVAAAGVERRRPPPARPATPCPPTGRRSARRRTPPTRGPAGHGDGVRLLLRSAACRSSTSKTRSKLTSALITSTRALASAVSGA